MNIKFKAEKQFDFEKKRFYLNKESTVLHCHHYTTLLTQLADDSRNFDGPEILYSTAEESFYPILTKYFQEHNITSHQDRVSIVQQYFSYIGLGLIKINFQDNKSTVEMPYSHLDEAWIKKWKSSDKPVNYLSQGFLAAAFSAITDNKPETFKVQEIQSIACGADISKFTVKKIEEK
jgi:predicted hydrocarbon binding protein